MGSALSVLFVCQYYRADIEILTTYPERKSNLVGDGSVFALGPVVGWKRSRTGAV